MKKINTALLSVLSSVVILSIYGSLPAVAATNLIGIQTDISNQTPASSSIVNTNTDASATTPTPPSPILNADINIDSDDMQLNSYAHSIAQNDPSISAIKTNSNNVSVSYKVPVKLFGFIPVNETETATVSTSPAGGGAQTSIHHSWWDFLARGNSSAHESAFSTALTERLGTSAPNPTQTAIMADIEAAAQSSLSTSTSGSVSSSY